MAAYVVRAETNGQALFDKLRAGSARIGWSSRDDLDLKCIINKKNSGGDLDGDQQEAWHYHGFVDVAQPEDLLFYPNVPDYGQFCVVKLTGDYSLLPDQEGIDGDFRSARPCKLITEKPIDKGDAIVPAVIRHKIGLQRRFYRLNVDQSDTDSLLRNLPNDSAAKAAYTQSFSQMMDSAQRHIAEQWSRFFPVASRS